jgi:hypothetical protein
VKNRPHRGQLQFFNGLLGDVPYNRAMAPKLRIAASVFFVALTVALVVLWVRSYRKADQIHFPWTNRSSCVIASKSGRLVVVSYRTGRHQREAGRYTYPVDDDRSFPMGHVGQYEAAVGFGTLQRPRYALPPPPAPSVPSVTLPLFAALQRLATRGLTRQLPGAGVLIPYWSVVTPLAAAVCALCFQRPRHWHFSLRTLLIATTLIAVLLGLIVWAAR